MLSLLSQWLKRRQMEIRKPFGKNLPDTVLRLTLCDQNAEMVDSFLEYFGGLEAVEVLRGNLLDLESDALVSPANSFGDMGGGIDQQIDLFYNRQAQKTVVEAIGHRFYGEMPVGAALVLEMSSRRFPFLVCSPTMRIPGLVVGTINAYLSMRAALVAVLQHNESHARKIKSLAVSGLCTGVGGMPPFRSAQQMRVAYDSIIGGRWKEVVHPAMAPFVRESFSER